MPLVLLPYKKIIEDKLDHDGTPLEYPDLANITDADAFEELAQNHFFF